VKPNEICDDADKDSEMSCLIKLFIETDQRLVEMTEGKVDSIAGPDGKIYLLSHAKDQLQHIELSRQKAILDALPASIALLDKQGNIQAVNKAWRMFAHAHTMLNPACSVGHNYLDICDSAEKADLDGPHEAAAGIRSVLDGLVECFSMKYSCDPPAGQRWFQMTVTPVAEGASKGAVIMHMNISESKKMEQILVEKEAMLRITSRIARLGGWSMSLPELQITWSDEICTILEVSPEYSPNFEQALSFYTPQSRATVSEAIEDCAVNGAPFDLELEVITATGQLVCVHCVGKAERDTHDDIIKLHGTFQDITESHKKNLRIRYLNRVYSMLSSFNTLMVRERDVDELYREACHIAVETGGFNMSLICIVDPDTKLINLVASAGKDEKFLSLIKQLFFSAESAPTTMVARAIREKRAIVSNDSHNDPQVLLRTAYAEAGIRSQAVLPLIIDNDAIGVLLLYSSDMGAFHEEELNLLKELAGDIAFASDNIDKQKRTDYRAYYDVLTGLANRTLFYERVGQYIRSSNNSEHKLAIILFNLDRFKNLNDSLGRSVGDILLMKVAEWLIQETGYANLLARIGADHYAIVVPRVKRESTLIRRLEKSINLFLGHPFHLADTDYRISARVGVAIFPDDGADAETLYSNAETALKQTRSRGVRYLFYSQDMTKSVASELTLENQLRQALENGEFVLHYQPKINLKSGKVTSAEALIRWKHPQLGLVPPGRFIPILEQTGLIYEVGRWVLNMAVQDYLRWCNTGLLVIPIAVNVSSLQLRNPGFLSDIAHATGTDRRAPAGLELEITESLIMEDIRRNITTLQAIRDMGISIAIDDFGTGFSSLSYLAKLPVVTLKIDQSFIVDMTMGPEGLALVSSIISLAHSLQLNVVAEGVETEEQSRLLHLLDCDEIQGFIVSKPCPADIFEANYLS